MANDAKLLLLTVPERCLTVANMSETRLGIAATMAKITKTKARESVASGDSFDVGRFIFSRHKRAACLGDSHNSGQGESFLHDFELGSDSFEIFLLLNL